MDFAVRTSFKSSRTWSEFSALRATQKAWRINSALGKTGAKFLSVSKGLGMVAAGASVAITGTRAIMYYSNGGTGYGVGAKATLDLAMAGVGFLGPIGFAISTTYFVVDAAGGFGDFGKIEE